MSVPEAPSLYESTVYKALLLPLTIMGVDYHYFIFEGGIIFCSFIFSKNFIVLLLFIPLNLAGVILQKFDPNFIQLLRVHVLTLKPGRNRRLWGCKSYAP